MNKEYVMEKLASYVSKEKIIDMIAKRAKNLGVAAGDERGVKNVIEASKPQLRRMGKMHDKIVKDTIGRAAQDYLKRDVDPSKASLSVLKTYNAIAAKKEYGKLLDSVNGNDPRVMSQILKNL